MTDARLSLSAASRPAGAEARSWLADRLARLDRLGPVHRLFLALLPRALARRFDGAAAGDLQTTVQLTLLHASGATSYALVIADGAVAVRPGPCPAAAARAQLGSADLMRLAGGAVGWPELLSSGRFELTGDPFLALRFAGLFRLPVDGGAAQARPA